MSMSIGATLSRLDITPKRALVLEPAGASLWRVQRRDGDQATDAMGDAKDWAAASLSGLSMSCRLGLPLLIRRTAGGPVEAYLRPTFAASYREARP